MSRFTADDIRSAQPAIAPVFRDSPQFVHEGLSMRLGVPVVVKIETLNPIRAFKGRGTWLAVSAMVGDGRLRSDHGAIVASSVGFARPARAAATSSAPMRATRSASSASV